MIYDTFTAANTAKGFFSFFDEFVYSEDVKRVYLIKGGPGTGKSTFMKKVANKFEVLGYDVEKVHCSSDCRSLDGIKIIEKGIVIIDATPPHAFDMKYPGAYETIIDMSKFWDEQKLIREQKNIASLCTAISQGYQNVYSLLRAAGCLEQNSQTFGERAAYNEKISAGVKKLLKQNGIVPIENSPKTENRMLTAFSGDGITTFTETFETLCDEFIVFDDKISIGHIYLSKIAYLLNKMGYDTMKIHSPLLPESRLEGVIAPKLRLGFITSEHLFSPEIDQSKVTKRINTKTTINKQVYSLYKNRQSLRKKITKELILSACNELSEIKLLHDTLESYYINATDYEALNLFTEQFINKI